MLKLTKNEDENVQLKALKIRGRLGGSANMGEPFPSRPRYMHRRTYQRLRHQYEAAVEQYVGGYVAASKGITVMGVPLAPGGAVATSRE